MPMRPESRGYISLASSNPNEAPVIHQAFLETDEELRVMRSGLRLVRELVAQDPLLPFAGEEILPGSQNISDEAIDDHIRKTMITVHHPVGTCKMGSKEDPLAVVDQEMRVRGVENLRVIDTSVMPDLIGGATNAPVIMMAEKASDMILKDSKS